MAFLVPCVPESLGTALLQDASPSSWVGENMVQKGLGPLGVWVLGAVLVDQDATDQDPPSRQGGKGQILLS